MAKIDEGGSNEERNEDKFQDYAKMYGKNTQTGRIRGLRASEMPDSIENIKKTRKKEIDELFKDIPARKHAKKHYVPFQNNYLEPQDLHDPEDTEDEDKELKVEVVVRETHIPYSLPDNDPNTHFRNKKSREGIQRVIDQMNADSEKPTKRRGLGTNFNKLLAESESKKQAASDKMDAEVETEQLQWDEIDDELDSIDIYDDIDGDED